MKQFLKLSKEQQIALLVAEIWRVFSKVPLLTCPKSVRREIMRKVRQTNKYKKWLKMKFNLCKTKQGSITG